MPTVFFKGLVVEVINAVSGLTARRRPLEELKKLTSIDAMKEFPRNTAIVKPMSSGESQSSDGEIICYPFFSSHIAMPLKPGEEVWFIYEDPDRHSQVAYWLSRVCGPNHTEDANFTFFRRAYFQEAKKPKVSLADKFLGNTAEEKDFTLINSPTTDSDEMKKLFTYAQDIHRFEAVPRYTKRPGDLILQGSNNSLIMLGEARGHYGTSDDVRTNSNDDDIDPNMGAIDIVVGRGARPRFGPAEIVNSIGLSEADKRVNNATEGDADFKEDAARLYLVAGTKQERKNHPDTLLNITLPSDTGFLGFPASKKSNGSFAILKADNLRIVARGSRTIPEAKGFKGLFNKETKDPGSIIILKEPSRDAIGLIKNDGAALILHDTGVNHIAGKEIRMMSYASSNGATEPYVKYTVLVKLITDILTDIVSFCVTSATNSTPGFGAPSPQITAAAATLNAQAAAKIVQLQTATLGLGSTIIYGE